MERKIRVFKNFEEQEAFHRQQMKKTSTKERFRRLYQMQQITRLFHPAFDQTRKIIIRNGHFQ